MKVFLLLAALVAAVSTAPSPPIHHGVDNRIIGGVNALVGEFPFVCSMQWVLITFATHICGCSILNSNFLLTAAHCITESPDLGSYRVACGIISLNTATSVGQIRPVQTYTYHPDWEHGPNVGPDDMAVMRVATAFGFNTYVQPIALPVAGVIPIGSATLAGWGATTTGIIPNMPDILQKVTKPILDQDVCLDSLRPLNASYLLADSNVCTGPLTGGISACSGDSGGPLVQTINGQTVIVGVVSWGVTPCGTAGFPSVYKRVSYYIGWINSLIN